METRTAKHTELMSLPAFQARFATDEACEQQLFKVRRPNDFVCSKMPERRVLQNQGPLPWFMIILTLLFLISYKDTENYSAINIKWIDDLRYEKSEVFPIRLSKPGCPEIPVIFDDITIHVFFDTGTSKGFLLTTAVSNKVKYTVVGDSKQLNADGSYRGESKNIIVGNLNILGSEFKNVSGTLADWKLFGSRRFNGTVGLQYFKNKRVTLDYKNKLIAVTDKPLPETLDRQYFSTDLLTPPIGQGEILYIRGKVNNQDTIIYIDTGYNLSTIDPRVTEGLIRTKLNNRQEHGFTGFRYNTVQTEINGLKLTLNNLLEQNIKRGTTFEYPVTLILGSDKLKDYIVTIDKIGNRLIFASITSNDNAN